jgi:hypothetical protein
MDAMDDTRLDALRDVPSPQFAEQLRARLHRQDARGGERTAGWPGRRSAAAMAVIAAAAGALAIPAVRASAASFLAMFRVVNFVAVRVDPARMLVLDGQQLDLRTLIGQHVEVIQEPGPPTPVASLAQAAAAAGLDLHMPAWLPDHAQIIEMAVTREGVARVTADAPRLDQVLDALGITDLRAPAGIHGQVVTIRVPPAVMVRYEHDGRRTRFHQARSPEVTMPAGMDVRALGEIGLRMLGLSAEEARQVSNDVSWHSTLILPIPPTASSVSEVDVSGRPGLAVQYVDQSRTNMVLWSTADRVYGLTSVQEMSQVVEMANSVR